MKTKQINRNKHKSLQIKGPNIDIQDNKKGLIAIYMKRTLALK